MKCFDAVKNRAVSITTRLSRENIMAFAMAPFSDLIKKERRPPANGNQISKAGKLSKAANIFNAFD
jgi:hypothetical protein